MSKVAVTGAAGFIGSNLVRALLDQNRKLTAIDNVSRGSKRNLAGLDIELMEADLRDYGQAKRAISDADTVFHLAARVGSIDYMHGEKALELSALQSNLSIDTNVFRACLETGVKTIIYASSVSVYPMESQSKLGARFAENDLYPINPEGGYGWAKFIGELQLELMETCRTASARIFNAYGEYNDFGKTAQVVSALIRKAINYPKEDFVVWGDGTQTRNFLYVKDCIEALLMMEKRASFPPLKLNLGSPITVTIGRLAEMIVKTSGKRIEVRFDPSKPVGPLSRIPDITKAKEAIGWYPKVAIEGGVKRTYDWMVQELAVV